MRAIRVVTWSVLSCSIDANASDYIQHTVDPPTIFPPYFVTGNRLFAAGRLRVDLFTADDFNSSGICLHNMARTSGSTEKSIRLKGPLSNEI